MSHFAKIDKNNVVTEIIVAEQDFIDSEFDDPSLWIQTSYNNNFRKQFASKGYTYDKENDVFISPKPYASWTLDANFDWQPPTAEPEIGDTKYYWNEDSQAWVEIT